MSQSILFRENQKFIQWWLWVLLISITAIPIYGLYKQVMIGEPFGSRPGSNMELSILLILMSIMLLFFYKMELRTEINPKEIRIRFFPFSTKTISIQEIDKLAVTDYGFVGGWGIRYISTSKVVYNVRGSKGLYVARKHKIIIIGTQKEEELRQVISHHFPDKINDLFLPN